MRGRRSAVKRRNFAAYYQVKLDTRQNQYSGVSQHELLYKLSKNKGAMVYYACPMVFDKTDLYEVTPDLDKLQLVELDSCPDIYQDYGHHHIFFENPTSTPIWKSEPHAGRAILPKEFVKRLVSRFADMRPEDSRQALEDILTDIHSLGINKEASIFTHEPRRDIVRLVEDSLTIVRVTRK